MDPAQNIDRIEERSVIRRTLTEAGIPEREPYPDQPGDKPEVERAALPTLRPLSLAERVQRLAARNWAARLLAEGMVAHCSLPLKVAGRKLIGALTGKPALIDQVSFPVETIDDVCRIRIPEDPLAAAAAEIEGLLGSEEAAVSVAHLLSELPTPSWGLRGTAYAQVGKWMLSYGGAWMRLHHRDVEVDGGLVAYFRQLQPDDVPAGAPNFIGWQEPPVGHYMVTDLGEGTRALKLRTGAMEGGQPVWDAVCAAARDVLGPQTDTLKLHDGPDGVVDRVAWTWNGGDIYLPAVAPADLPRRLCQVLLAAYRIARLEVPARRVKCDGNHGGPRCSDPGCWNDEVPR